MGSSSPPAAFALLTLAAVASGCGPGTPTAAVNAAINTGIAAAVSGARRSQGDCYTPCHSGTVCNPDTGYCETLPCDGQCESWQRCVSGLVPRCVSIEPLPEATEDPTSPDSDL